MNPILLAILVLGVLGLIGGVILVLASKFMAVYEDPRVAQVNECLAGANCGGCGFAGCADYADAIVNKGAPITKCAPGGLAASEGIAKIMGGGSDGELPKRAFVTCDGGINCNKKYDYHGMKNCLAASQISGGPSACSFGCIGFGDCMDVCLFNAIHVENGVARVDRTKCTGCGACIVTCPRGVIRMKTIEAKPILGCINNQKGALVKNICTSGCIGCGICAKNCPKEAITIIDNLAKIDEDKCVGCGLCVKKCPKKVIHWSDGKKKRVPVRKK